MIEGPGFKGLREEFKRLHWDIVRMAGEESRTAAEHPGQPAAQPCPPRVDVWEDGGRLYVEVELPGVPANSVEAALRGQELLVTGERRAPGTGISRWHRQERSRGPFTWAVPLPAAVLVDGLRFLCQDGILYVSAPLVAPAATRQVPIMTP